MAENTEYVITITTSDTVKDAGLDGHLFIELIGRDNAKTETKKLDSRLKRTFKAGRMDVFKFKTADIGVPQFICIELRGNSKKMSWACDEVIVCYKQKEVVFPVYDWITDSITVASGEAFSYTRASDALRKVRAEQIQKARTLCEWVERPNESDIGWGIPRFIGSNSYQELPKLLQNSQKREENFDLATVKALANTTLATVKGALEGLDSLDDFRKLYKHLHNGVDPPFIHKWDSDVEFGRQQLMGVTPLALKRCKSLPDCCKIKDCDVSKSLEGNSLENEMEEGKIFIGDYSEVFQGVIRNKSMSGTQLHCPDAIGLFRVNSNLDLVPIAIQLERDDPNTVFTPNDSPDDWLLAKMYYRTAAANLHEWHYHFVMTHNVMETFFVALYRCVPRSHPVYKLLWQHLHSVSAINTKAREGLITEGSMANKSLAILGIDLAKATFKNFNIKDLMLPDVLEERGLDDENLLPRNYFRDDALRLWKIIEEFVQDMLKIYYENDEEVQMDEELQAFAKEIAHEGLGWQNGDTKGMKDSFDSLEYLIRICTTLIYTSSVNHASVNFPQYEYYRFIPNAPTGMRLPPHKKGEATPQRILDSLPSLTMATVQINISYTLSQYSSDEVYLGEYPMRLFVDQDALKVIGKFRIALCELSNEIKKRNDSYREYAYEWLLPEKIPNGIAI